MQREKGARPYSVKPSTKSIYVCDRNLGLVIDNAKATVKQGSLTLEIKVLKEQGYNVQTAGYFETPVGTDLIIAHLSDESAKEIDKYHKTHPLVPILVYSGNSWTDQRSTFAPLLSRSKQVDLALGRVDKDGEGNYSIMGAHIDEFKIIVTYLIDLHAKRQSR